MGGFARFLILSAAVVAAFGTAAGASGPESADRTFPSTVRPILERRCRPCHFPGGTVYGRLPFDRPETVRRLGSARLFTRLKDEKERAAIRAFLGEPAPPRR